MRFLEFEKYRLDHPKHLYKLTAFPTYRATATSAGRNRHRHRHRLFRAHQQDTRKPRTEYGDEELVIINIPSAISLKVDGFACEPNRRVRESRDPLIRRGW